MKVKKSVNNSGKIAKSIVTGTVLSAIICVALLSIISLLLVKSGVLPYDYLEIVTTVTLGLSAFIGAYIALSFFKSNGLLSGILSSLLLTVIISIVSAFTANKTTAVVSFTKTAVILIAGALGGFLSVNRKKRRY